MDAQNRDPWYCHCDRQTRHSDLQEAQFLRRVLRWTESSASPICGPFRPICIQAELPVGHVFNAQETVFQISINSYSKSHPSKQGVVILAHQSFN